MDFEKWLDAEKGRTSEVAQHFGLTTSAVSQWRSNGVPRRRMKAVRAFTKGEVGLADMLKEASDPDRIDDKSQAAHEPEAGLPQADSQPVAAEQGA